MENASDLTFVNADLDGKELLVVMILMSVSWDKMIVITFVKTIQWVVTDAGVTKVTSYLVTIEHAKT
ncbi:hypothetical protein P5673_000604 [Acropora cervicornis]|uniref:Uncharacterized protein n=1 Tax=Acropora cervicornis TaxID=6130 RepID=A0AAD9R7B0_ACRCE|nr:hypothetical protein P5673_000604 [Acropora cervicornis]